jgi:serine/threonine protein kinase
MSYEYIDGPTLADVLRQQRVLSEPRALGIALGIARALTCAEENRVVHRNLRPAKILLNPTGVPKLSDLGMATRHDAFGRAISGTLRFGSPFYTAPEVAQGGEIDHRADLYSLGITLYHMLSGELPYAREPIAQRVEQLRVLGLPLASEANPRISARASRLCQRLAAWEPDDRYPTAAALVVDLETMDCKIKAPAKDSEQRFLLETRAIRTSATDVCVRIRVEKAREEILRREFERTKIRIGRSDSVDLRIDDAVISRVHAELSWDENKMMLSPLSTTNATTVNGKRIHESTELEKNDLVQLSDEYTVFVDWDTTDPPPAASDKGTTAWSATDEENAEAEAWLEALGGDAPATTGTLNVPSADANATATVTEEQIRGDASGDAGALESLLEDDSDEAADEKPTTMWVPPDAHDSDDDEEDKPTARFDPGPGNPNPSAPPAAKRGDDAPRRDEEEDADRTAEWDQGKEREDIARIDAELDAGTAKWSGDIAGPVLFPKGSDAVSAIGLIQVGSGDACAIRLDPSAPRKAALFINSNGTVLLVNVADDPAAVSRNEDQVPDKVVLEDGDVLMICDLEIRFEIGA